MSDEEFRKQLAAISAEYRQTLPAKLATIESLWSSLSTGQHASAGLTDLLRELHSIAGSARTFGVAGVSEAAAAAESFLEPFARSGKLPPTAKRARFELLLGALRQAAS